MELTDKEIAENRRKRLKECRIKNNLFIEDVAEMAGVGKSSVSRWETGNTENIKLAILHKLASFYNVNAAWLFGYDVPMLPETKEHQTIREMINAWMRDASFEDLKKFEALARITFNKGDDSK